MPYILTTSSQTASGRLSSSLSRCVHVACGGWEEQEKLPLKGVCEREKGTGIYLYAPIPSPTKTRQGVCNRKCTPLHLWIVSGALWCPLMKTCRFIVKPKSNKGYSAWIELDRWSPEFQCMLMYLRKLRKAIIYKQTHFLSFSTLVSEIFAWCPMQKEIASNAHYCIVRAEKYN